MSDEFAENSSEVNKEEIEFYKKQFIKLGFFLAIITVLSSILILLTFTSKSSYTKGLEKQVNKVLKENSIEDKVGKQIEFDSLFSTTASAWQLSENKNTYVFIIRVTTLYSAVPCVFIYDKEKNKSSFLSFVALSKRAEKNIKQSAFSNQIAYWKNKIPSIVEKSFNSKEVK